MRKAILASITVSGVKYLRTYRIEIAISSPMNTHGNNGSKGTSLRNPPGAKKNPAATNGA
jgi:hypothetical protein